MWSSSILNIVLLMSYLLGVSAVFNKAAGTGNYAARALITNTFLNGALKW
jgi:hypothetical protein